MKFTSLTDGAHLPTKEDVADMDTKVVDEGGVPYYCVGKQHGVIGDPDDVLSNTDAISVLYVSGDLERAFEKFFRVTAHAEPIEEGDDRFVTWDSYEYDIPSKVILEEGSGDRFGKEGWYRKVLESVYGVEVPVQATH